MEVIEKMPDTQYESICNAGVELVQALASIVKKYGLGHEQAFNVIVVAAAGVAAVSDLTAENLAEGVESVLHMWKVSEDQSGDRQLTFDPTHMRSDAVPQAQDPLAAN